MRKGSIEWKTGLARRVASTASGLALLILPVYTAGVILAPLPVRAQEQDTASPTLADDEKAVREAIERRTGGSWLDRANQLASRRRMAVVRRKPKPKVARARAVKIIHTRATWYGPGFHGRRTASGERFNQNAMTLASRHLPFGTQVRVVNMKTGRSAVGRVNDRGPFRGGYTADLSKALAFRIGMRGSGPVRLEILPRGAKK